MENLAYIHLSSAEEVSAIESNQRNHLDFLGRLYWNSRFCCAAMGLLSVAVTVTVLNVSAGSALALQKVGSSGAEVTNIQRCLSKLGYYNGPVNGNFRSLTANAVKRFQQANGLPADGVVGYGTQTRLQSLCESNTNQGYVNGDLRIGSTGSQVTMLQEDLQHLGYFNGRVTGYFGDETKQAVIRFQQANRILADGVVGARTLALIHGSNSYPPYQGNNGNYPPPYQGNNGNYPPPYQGNNGNYPPPYQGNNGDYPPPYQGNNGDYAGTGGEYPILSQGSRGREVRELQETLRQKGFFSASATGYFGPLTKDAVISFQQSVGLQATGTVDSQTWQALRGSQVDSRSLSVGDSGDQVRRLQERLLQRGYLTGTPNGYFDESTRVAVSNFQRDYQLPQSGNADANTLAALGISNSNGHYVVVIPIENERTLAEVQRTVPSAYADKNKLGRFVNAGVFSDRSIADHLSDKLRSRRFDARVVFSP